MNTACKTGNWKHMWLLVLFVIVLGCRSGSAQSKTDPISLWPETVPGEAGRDIGPERFLPQEPDKKQVKRLIGVTDPTITVFRPEKTKRNGAAVLVAPGGGYHILAWDLEGTEVAEWLNSIGITAVLLKYRVPQREGVPRHKPPLQDAQRALSMVRSRADEWNIDPDRIGMLGFSAGAHLTAVSATQDEERAYEPRDAVDEVPWRPDFGVLVYPAYLADKERSNNLSPEVAVSESTPPMFLVQAGNDQIGVENSVFMYHALQNAGVQAELHVYPRGGHGFGLRPSDKPISNWPDLCETWFRTNGMLDGRFGQRKETERSSSSGSGNEE